jgi:hypothetical protein
VLAGSTKVTISPISAFSATGFCASLSFAGALPRTILTVLHSVPGKLTSWTLLAFVSIAWLTISALVGDLEFEVASAAFPCS